MNRAGFVAALAATAFCGETAASAARPAVTQTGFDLATPSGTIFGTLAEPAGAESPPVVLIVAGSGPIDRDGNAAGLQTDAYRLLSVALARVSIACLRYDKRGVGASAAAAASGESDLRFETYVADAEAYLRKLRADGRFAKIAVAGHSEGSLIGMLAAARAPVDAFISLEGAGFPAAEVLRTQLQPKLAGSPQLAAANERILEALEHGKLDADVPAELGALYRSSVQPYLISWFRYDPRVEIAKLACPVTIVQGTADLQVSLADANALAHALPAARLVVAPGMSHVLKPVGEMSEQDQRRTVYTDPARPIDPAVPRAIAAALGVVSAPGESRCR